MHFFHSLSFRQKIIAGSISALVLAAGISYYFYFVHVPKGAESFRSHYDLILKDYDGNPVELAQFKRKLLVVHAWASWCPYCGDELKNLSQLKTTYGDDVTILAVNRAESVVEAKPYTDALGTTGIQFLLDPEDAFYKGLGGYAMPETIFIDQKGMVIYHQRGPMNIDEVTAKINTLLGN